MAAMIKDVEMLKKFNLMDYSLLLCIQENPNYGQAVADCSTSAGGSVRQREALLRKTLRDQFKESGAGSRHKFLGCQGRYIYHLGIIDYLQDYNIEKKLENFAKKQVYGNMISAVPPANYALRYLRFMRDNVIIDQRTAFQRYRDKQADKGLKA